jgi:hypothetical protein
MTASPVSHAGARMRDAAGPVAIYNHIMKPLLTILVCWAVFLPSRAHGWHDEGHHYIALAAVRSLPPQLPAFFREGHDLVAHCSIDPDLHAEGAIAISRDADAPNHYIDLEMLGEHSLPATRHQFIKLCHELGLDPAKVGYLPYQIEEWTQRLAMAFAEHRKWPDNPHVRVKTLVYAGYLAHYSGDLVMPLHTTVHFNGRVTQNPDGTWPASPRTGIHTKVDALPTKLPYHAIFPPDQPLPAPVLAEGDALAAIIRAELRASHALVDRTYELEDKLPEVEVLEITDEAIRAFTIERTRAGAAFTAKLYLFAWELSGRLADRNVAPPFWLDRETFDFKLDLDAVPPQPVRPERGPVQLTP